MKMTVSRLRTLTVQDFRSIRGTVSIPLTAPVVLLHGANGAGKTSVMAALEMVLTGDIRGFPDNQSQYMVHRGATAAHISLMTDTGAHDISLHRDGSGAPRPNGWLEPEDAAFFSERCYLAQAMLGRLLEIYEASPRRYSESPLTRFVKELLKLDQLDALIEGLRPLGDVRNVRTLVPAYERTEQRLDGLRQELARGRAERDGLSATRARLRSQIAEALDALSVEGTLSRWPASENFKVDIDDELTRLAGYRREIASATSQWEAISVGAAIRREYDAEENAMEARRQAEWWWSQVGRRLAEALHECGDEFADLAEMVRVRPDDAYFAGVERLRSMLSASEAREVQDRNVELELATRSLDAEHAAARLQSVRDDLESVERLGESESLVRLLAELENHVKNNDCPVCGRDYGEISAEPLSAHIAAEVTRISTRANQLQELSKAVLEATADAQRLDQRVATLKAQRRSVDTRVAEVSRGVWLHAALARVQTFEAAAKQGSPIISAVGATARLLGELRSNDRLISHLRSDTLRLEQAIGLQADPDHADLGSALHRLAAVVTGRSSALERAAQAFEAVEQQYEEYERVDARSRDSAETIERLEREIETLRAQLDAFEIKRDVTRAFLKKATGARIRTVQDVFGQSLNRTWRELFVRLAPNERYAPAFKIPDGSGAVVATLETVHRDGDKGGTPAAMLSAGNLNTAALTLFLALHMSVPARVPWLLLDDPVQSMDEVHIAQFAALLRTLAKQHRRRIVIAVHERPLFEYLALELSPASPGDQLTTVELERSIDGNTRAALENHVYEEDEALAAS